MHNGKRFCQTAPNYMKFGRMIDNSHSNNNMKKFLKNIKNLKRDLSLKLKNTLDTSMLLVCVCVAWHQNNQVRQPRYTQIRPPQVVTSFFPHFLQTSKLDFQKLIRILRSNWSSDLEPKVHLFKQRTPEFLSILIEFSFETT